MRQALAERSWRVAVDTGGTFTDALAIAPDGTRSRVKVLSSSSLRATVLEVGVGGRRLRLAAPSSWTGLLADMRLRLSRGGKPLDGRGWILSGPDAAGWVVLAEDGDLEQSNPGDTAVILSDEEAPVLAARLLTRTPRSRPLPPLEMRLGTTRATNALLEGRGARVGVLATAGLEELLLVGDQRRADLFDPSAAKPSPLATLAEPLPGRLGADGAVVETFDPSATGAALARLRDAGAEAVVVSYLHGPRVPEREARTVEEARRSGWEVAVAASGVSRAPRLLDRTRTAVVEARLKPVLDGYLRSVAASLGDASTLALMTSAGGLSPRERFRAVDSLLSGPAGGVEGAARVGAAAGEQALLLLDMGGTSTDAARWAGSPEVAASHAVGGTRVLAPSLRIESVAAGGGSICRWDGGIPTVGPASAGADPGPACYGGGGPFTLTDADLLLGHLDANRFGVPVDRDAALAALAAVFGGDLPSDWPARLAAWRSLAAEKMAEAIRVISVREGYDPAAHAMVAFGGAGGVHACAVASRLGVSRVIAPADAGLLSAAGLLVARVEAREIDEEPFGLAGADAILAARVHALEERVMGVLGGVAGTIEERRATVRRRGQEAALVVDIAGGEAELREAYARRHREVFGVPPDVFPLEVARLEVVARGPAPASEREVFAPRGDPRLPESSVEQWDGTGWVSVPAHARERMVAGEHGMGPALVADTTATLAVGAGWRWVVGDRGTVRLERVGDEAARPVGIAASFRDQLVLERLRGTVEAMGEQLRRMALSANIRDREDFSCAVLDAEGRLMVNAPHVPVHLGALGIAVRAVSTGREWRPGDVVVTNHPGFGGSHLPDVTVIAPSFASGSRLPRAFVAVRAHHAEIGGIRPGSMPPAARNLAEEGVVIAPRWLLREGEDGFPALAAMLESGPYPSRAVAENLADLRAQVAALRLGLDGLATVAGEWGDDALPAAFLALRESARRAAADLFARIGPGCRSREDRLDDGTPLAVEVQVGDRGLVIDFRGTGGVHPRNLNATPAIVRSVVLFALRLLAGGDLPLNEGLLEEVEIRVPQGLLDPPFGDDPTRDPPVVGGNVETSQRLVDLLLAALGPGAAGQGTMNNVIFGGEGFSHYETLGGGAGAGPWGDGGSAVHVGMTNTALTDPETLERRFPVRLRRLAIRRGSGGAGRHRGGDGMVREFEFLAPASLSILSQRRVAGAPGVDGGSAGLPGRQRVIRKDGTEETLPPLASVELAAGDRLVVETPGGGGWGFPAVAAPTPPQRPA